jgi:MYXO-CTERM domain-containing protein
MTRINALAALLLVAQPASAARPDYHGGPHGKATYSHDGRLRWAVGVQNVQVVRAAPDNPALTDGSNTIYRHHSMIAYWGGRFWVMHDGGGTRVAWSKDGLTWSVKDAASIFSGCSHHRMGFYVAPNGRLLASHWNGVSKGGQGTRLVREIAGPNAFGAVHAIRHNHNGPSPKGSWPSFDTSPDAGFKAACSALLADQLFRQQWQEEDQDPTFYAISSNDGRDEWKAFSWYRLPDQRVAGFWKGIYTTVSKGPTWDTTTVPNPVKTTSFRCNTGAKTWSERTEDGRYAFVGCANDADARRRWPLAVTTSTDGLSFTTPYLVVAGDIPPSRYENANGDNKNAGPQYVRGISPGNGDPPGADLWLTYSMNKEDIWVAAVPLPVTGRVQNNVNDDFQGHAPGRRVKGWNTYSPQWAPVMIAADGANRFLRLEDGDPADYASATRVFPQTDRARLAFKVRPHQVGASSPPLEIDVVSHDGSRAVALALDPAAGKITARDGAKSVAVASYKASAWIVLELRVSGASQRYSLSVNGAQVLGGAAFLEAAPTVERVVFRTGAFRLRDFSRRPVDDPWLTTRLPGADVKQTAGTFDVDAVALGREEGLIASIDHVSTGRPYQIGVASQGAKVYTDRDYAIQSLPAALAGLELIRTSNEDDYVSAPDHLRFTLSKNATVYVAMEKHGGGAMPAWAAGWTDAAMEIQVPGAGAFRVHGRSFAKGQVTLGGNDRENTGAVSNYFVLAAAEPGQETDAGAPDTLHDAGVAGSDAGAAVGADPGTSAAPSPSPAAGCACHVAGADADTSPLLLLGALIGLLLWVRRSL